MTCTKDNDRRGHAEIPPLQVDIIYERKKAYTFRREAEAKDLSGLSTIIVLVDRYPSPVRHVSIGRLAT